MPDSDRGSFFSAVIVEMDRTLAEMGRAQGERKH
jgi:hypothetical protein